MAWRCSKGKLLNDRKHKVVIADGYGWTWSIAGYIGGKLIAPR